MRVAVVVLRAEAAQLQHVLDRALHAVLGLDVLQPERRADDGAHGVPGVQRGVRVLEDHLDVPAQRPDLPGAQVGDVHPLELHAAAGRFEQPGDQPAHCRLAAAGLADHAQGLPGVHREADPVDRLHGPVDPLEQALADGEVLLQPGDPQQRLALGRRCRLRHRRDGAVVSHGGSRLSRSTAGGRSPGRRSPSGSPGAGGRPPGAAARSRPAAGSRSPRRRGYGRRRGSGGGRRSPAAG